jgi:hypothetical protein
LKIQYCGRYCGFCCFQVKRVAAPPGFLELPKVTSPGMDSKTAVDSGFNSADSSATGSRMDHPIHSATSEAGEGRKVGLLYLADY